MTEDVPEAQFKQFLDTPGPLLAEGKLADEVAGGFTSARNPHGGQESTLISMYKVFMHRGAIVVRPGTWGAGSPRRRARSPGAVFRADYERAGPLINRGFRLQVSGFRGLFADAAGSAWVNMTP